MNPWAVLDIEPTADAAAIRRAYARRLKANRPDADADAFQNLRAARELALREAVSLEGATIGPARGTGAPSAPAADRPAAVPDDEAPSPRVPVRDDARPETPRTARDTPPADAKPLIVAIDDAVAPSPAGTPVPVPRIVDVAADSDEDLARRVAVLVASLKACLVPLGAAKARVDRVGFETLLREAAVLPRKPREAAEVACLQAFATALRGPAGFAPRQALRVRPLLVAADGAFDWSRDDAVLTASVPARDADVLVLMLRETYREQDAGPAAGLRFGDARAFFALWPDDDLRAQLLRPGPVPRRFRFFAAVAPHLWALRHGRWLAALVLLGIGWAAAILAVAGFDVPRPAGPMLVALGLIAFALWLLGGGFYADRILAAAAVRAVRRANNRGLFDPQVRERALSRTHRPVSFWFLIPMMSVGATFVLTPYVGILVAIARALGAR